MKKLTILVKICMVLLIVMSTISINTVNSLATNNGIVYSLFDDNLVEIIDYIGNDQNVTIPSYIDGMEIVKISGCAFQDNEKITSISIPGTVKEIEYQAFHNCKNLKNINIQNGVTYIGDFAFSNCDSLTSIIIPNSVIDLGQYAFFDCENLKKVVLPNKITKISNSIFWQCTNLSDITIPNTVKSIEIQAFTGCEKLKNIKIPNSVTNIEDSVFMRCESLTSITIPNNIKSIKNQLFSGCVNLRNVKFSNKLTSMGSFAFSDCKNLTNIKIPSSVKEIGEYAFSGCSSLSSITIPNGVTNIKESTFSSCKKLKSLIIPKTVKKIHPYAFYCCDKLTLYVYKGSYAEKYAKKNRESYKVIKHITSVKLNKINLSLKKNSSKLLKATINPSKTTDSKTLKWSSSNTKIAKVNSKGKVSAINYGKAVITVKTSNDKTAKCTITVPYTITYKLNKGKNNKSNPSTYYGKKIILKKPKRKGYRFVGWYTDSKFKNKITSFSSGNKTVYAKWKKL